MSEQTYYAAGADQAGNRWDLCLLDERGKSPRYYRGRCDTPGGQKKIITYLGETHRLAIIEGELAIILLSRLGPSRIIIVERALFSRWERSGLERGRAVARMAALSLIEGITQPAQHRLTEKERLKILELEGKRMEEMIAITDESQKLISLLKKGEAPPSALAKALSLQERSRVIEQPDFFPPDAEEGESLLSRLFRLLKGLK